MRKLFCWLFGHSTIVAFVHINDMSHFIKQLWVCQHCGSVKQLQVQMKYEQDGDLVDVRLIKGGKL